MTNDDGLYWSSSCRDCFSCKQKAIRSQRELKEFCELHEHPIRKGWRQKLRKDKKIILYWCSKERQRRLKSKPPGVGQKKVDDKFCNQIDN